jgi:hypothetical protein
MLGMWLEFADSLTSGLPSTHEFAQFAPSLPWRGPLTGPLVAGFCHTGKTPANHLRSQP